MTTTRSFCETATQLMVASHTGPNLSERRGTYEYEVPRSMPMAVGEEGCGPGEGMSGSTRRSVDLLPTPWAHASPQTQPVSSPRTCQQLSSPSALLVATTTARGTDARMSTHKNAAIPPYRCAYNHTSSFRRVHLLVRHSPGSPHPRACNRSFCPPLIDVLLPL
jgi:hypothetical protein